MKSFQIENQKNCVGEQRDGNVLYVENFSGHPPQRLFILQ